VTVRVINLGRRHPGTPARVLTDVSFEITAGTLVAITGPSGGGKTTLLRCLAGLEPFEHGTVEIEDLRVVGCQGAGGRRANARARAALRQRVGLVFQSLELFPHLTVLENCVLAPIHVRRLARADAERPARDLLARLGLGDKLAAYPQHLSGGQCQRAAIARALAMEPRVLLYDEPTSALDASLKNEVAETLRQVRGTGVTQLVVTHDLAFADAVADVRFALEAGRLRVAG